MQNGERTYRGRPKGSIRSQSDIKLLGYLALISVKYKVDSSVFFNKIVEAWNQQKSVCEGLLIERQEQFHDRAIFLITEGDKVVTQFCMPEYLLRKSDPLKDFKNGIRLPSKHEIGDEKHPVRIKDLKAGMKKVNLKARVIELAAMQTVLTRFGTYAKLVNAVIGDETGNIKLPLWNVQIDMVSKGDQIMINNAKVVRYRGELQLRNSRRGNMKIIETDEDLTSKTSD